jgi:hypothetical protein
VVNPAPRFGEKALMYRRLVQLFPQFKEFFFVDNDTIFVADPAPVFDLPGYVCYRLSKDRTLGKKVEHFKPQDMAYPDLHQPEQIAVTVAEVPSDHPYYHAGACLFRVTPPAQRYFKQFEVELERFGLGMIEEWAMVRAEYKTGAGITPLPDRFNSFPLWYRDINHAKRAGAVMLHFYGPKAKPQLYTYR